MNTVFSFFSSVFSTIILKPLDILLFGGSGVLWRPRAYYTDGLNEHLKDWHSKATPEQRAVFMGASHGRSSNLRSGDDEADPLNPMPTAANLVDPTWQFFHQSDE